MADLLLVDNDARIAELVAFFLRRSGHAVRTAPSFAAARAQIERAWPDLVLSDLDLGAERGLDELARLAAEGLLPPTLVVSGYADRAAQVELERLAQVVGVVSKPFQLDVLLARVEAALAESAARVRGPSDTRDELGVAEGADPRAEPGDGWVELAPGTERA